MTKYLSFIKFLSPYLFSLSSLLIYYFVNINEVLPQDLFQSSIFIILIVGLLNITLKLLINNFNKRTLILFILSFILFYSNVISYISSSILKNDFKIYVSISIIIILSFIIGIIIKCNKNVNKILTILIILTLYLFITNSSQIFITEYNIFKSNKELVHDLPQLKSDNKYDIYFIILDRYANNHTFKSIYNYDNSSFTDNLKKRNLFIADKSFINYNNTPQSIVSQLNMEYLHATVDRNPELLTTKRTFSTLFGENRLTTMLSELGYKTYYIGARWGLSKAVKADENLTYDGNYNKINPVFSIFTNNEKIAFFTNNYFSENSPIRFISKNDNRIRNDYKHTEYQFAKTIEIAKQKDSPKFVFTHILLPHDPYIFNSDCSFQSETSSKLKNEVDNYVEQVKCTNTKTIALIDEIQNITNGKSIIVLQSDEGPNSLLYNYKDYGWDNHEALKEKFPNLLSIYFPDHDYSKLQSTITPVNIFRYILNKYFDTNFPILDNKCYVILDKYNGGYSSLDTSKFKDVTEEIIQYINTW